MSTATNDEILLSILQEIQARSRRIETKTHHIGEKVGVEDKSGVPYPVSKDSLGNATIHVDGHDVTLARMKHDLGVRGVKISNRPVSVETGGEIIAIVTFL